MVKERVLAFPGTGTPAPAPARHHMGVKKLLPLRGEKICIDFFGG